MMHGLNTYDYGARQYNSVIPAWDRMDPLCEKYYSVSPYAYCGNNPVRLRDRAGMEPGDAFESLDEAALNFCSIFNYWSIRPSAGYPYGAEYASTFYSYKNEDNKTLYSYYVSGPQNAASALLNLQDLEKVPVDRRKTFQLVASGHTHGGDDSYSNEPHSGNRFSNADLVSDRDIHKQVSTYTAGYLATPNGTFMKHWFNKKSGKWMIITFKGEKYQLPSDANDSTHGKYTFQDIKKKYDDTPWYKKILTSMNKYLEQQQYK